MFDFSRSILERFREQGPRRTDRIHRNQEDQRTPFQRDRDRILYTDYFHRLSGVSQVARTGESYLYHDRQSHTLKVAQTGRRLTEHLPEITDQSLLSEYGRPSPDVVEAAALAHDLGHPPFGHPGEDELDDCVRNEGVAEGFEANAQAFRIVTKLATHRENYDGLDLTRATLNAILKYPWSHGENDDKPNKWGYFKSEQSEFDFARESFDRMNQSIEAQIMDWADDVTYAVHDLVDFYRAGLLPFDRLLDRKSEEAREFLDHIYKNTDVSSDRWRPEVLLDALKEIAGPSLRKPYTGSLKQKSQMNQFSSHLVGRFLGYPSDDEYNPVRMEENEYSDGLFLNINPLVRKDVEFLKEMTRYYIINDSSLMAQQHGQRKVVRTLFSHMVDQSWPDAEFQGMLPSPYKERIRALDNTGTQLERVRVVTDLISRLTEKQATLLYERLEGVSPGTLQDRIIHF